MPYANRKYRKRGYSRYKRGSAGVKALRAVKSLKKLVKPEIKLYDFTYGSPNVITSSAVVFTISDVTQGLDINEMIGREINLLKLTMRFSISANASTSFNYLRMLIFSDASDNNNSVPAANEVLDVSTNYLSAVPGRNSIGRFTFLHDKIYTVHLDKDNISMKLNVPLRHKRATFAQSGSQDRNHIYVLLISSDAANGPSFQMYSRLMYTD